MACNCSKKRAAQQLATMGRRTRALRVEYCVTTPDGDECFLVQSEARRFAKKSGYSKPQTRERARSSA